MLRKIISFFKYISRETVRYTLIYYSIHKFSRNDRRERWKENGASRSCMSKMTENAELIKYSSLVLLIFFFFFWVREKESTENARHAKLICQPGVSLVAKSFSRASALFSRSSCTWARCHERETGKYRRRENRGARDK